MGGCDSSSDEPASDASLRCDSGFRVSVCLRRYFSDERARAFVLASRHRRVRWLQRRVRRAFALRGAFCLRAAGHLLPPAEPLRLLAPGERVEVIPLQETGNDNLNQQNSIRQLKETESHTEEITVTRIATFGECGRSEAPGAAPPAVLPAHSPARSPARSPVHSAAHSPVHSAAHSPAHSPARSDSSSGRAGGDEGLRALKRRALELLDARCAPAPRRRRVRRRARRAPSAPAAPSAPSAPPAPPHHSADVTRNEAACARKPRVVRSLGTEHDP